MQVGYKKVGYKKVGYKKDGGEISHRRRNLFYTVN